MRIQTPFRANYEIESPPQLPSSGAGVVYFPPVHPGEGRIYEERLKFTHLGQPTWYGVFATQFREGLSLVSTLPNPEWCCVSSVGTGYLLNVGRPEEWHAVPVSPVLHVTIVNEPQLLLLNCFTRIVAYGNEGKRWMTDSLCSDELKVVAVKGDMVECTGWDAATGDEILLRLDLASGKWRRRRHRIGKGAQ